MIIESQGKRIILFFSMIIFTLFVYYSYSVASYANSSSYELMLNDSIAHLENDTKFSVTTNNNTGLQSYTLRRVNGGIEKAVLNDVSVSNVEETVSYNDLKYIVTVDSIPNSFSLDFIPEGRLWFEKYIDEIYDPNHSISKREIGTDTWPFIALSERELRSVSDSSIDSIRHYEITAEEGTDQVSVKFFFALDTSECLRGYRTLTMVFVLPEVQDVHGLQDFNVVNNSGQIADKTNLFSNGSTGIVAGNGRDSVDVQFTVGNGYSLTVDGVDYPLGMSNIVNVTLSCSIDGIPHSIKIIRKGKTIETYNIVSYSRMFSGLPDKVIDYLCIASQYTNEGAPAGGKYGTTSRAVYSLRGAWPTSTSQDSDDLPPFSLGNFGGYVTYYYDDPITNDPSNPYGIDFIVYGNSVNGGPEFAEPGNVLVSEDGEDWYTLAGSLHYDDSAIWNQSKVYSRDIVSNYPIKKYYELHNWNDGEEESISVSGTIISPNKEESGYGNSVPTFPSFGYADCGVLGTSNVADNPYSGTQLVGRTRTFTINKTDGFDLSWAVDSEGYPVEFENGIHYIKIQTASSIVNGSIGEKSTEINMVRRAAKRETAVGKTNAPDNIQIDGNDIELIEGENCYTAEVNGPFEVKVSSKDDAEVYINSMHGDIAYLKEAPHGIVRIIVQSGDLEPRIYYIRIEQKESDEDIKTVTLQTGSMALIGDLLNLTLYYDRYTNERRLPLPTPHEDYQFDGWYDGYGDDAKEYKTFDDITGDHKVLYAKCSPKTEDEGDAINVSFRLIGSTLSKSGVDMSMCDIDTQYQTWYATREYEVPYASTVYDVFVKAMEQAGLEARGANNGYVTTIFAPEVLGGYELSEMTNGPYSGWMYTLNGEHKNGIKIERVEDGDEIVFHYVNDYRYEVDDWDKLGGVGWPQFGTDPEMMNRWLLADDIDPGQDNNTGDNSSGNKDRNNENGGNISNSNVNQNNNRSNTSGDTRKKVDEGSGKTTNEKTDIERKVKAAKIKKAKAQKTKIKVKALKKRKAKITWKKLKGVTGYKIYRATKKKGKYKLIKTIRKAGKTKYINKKLNKSKKYFYKVRPYTKIGGKVYPGKWSNRVKIKAKK